VGGFADNVGDWAKESEARLTACFRRAVELLADEMTTTRSKGGKLPHRTGNLMRSLLASTTAMPRTGDGPFVGQDIGLVAAGLDLGDTIYIGYQAAYARRLNYGFVGDDSLGRTYNQEGAHFVEYAASMWPILVQLAAEEVRNKVMTRA